MRRFHAVHRRYVEGALVEHHVIAVLGGGLRDAARAVVNPAHAAAQREAQRLRGAKKSLGILFLYFYGEESGRVKRGSPRA